MFCGSRTFRASVSAVARGARDRTGPGGPWRAEPCPRGGGPGPAGGWPAAPDLPIGALSGHGGCDGAGLAGPCGGSGRGGGKRARGNKMATRLGRAKWRRAGGRGRRCAGEAGRGRGGARMRVEPGGSGTGPGVPAGAGGARPGRGFCRDPAAMLLPCPWLCASRSPRWALAPAHPEGDPS